MAINKLQILPSIFAANIGKMESELEKIKNSHIERIHYDIMDNHFVPNISFGISFVEQIMSALPTIKGDIHLMIDLPGHWESYLTLQPEVLTIHLEAGTQDLVISILKKIRESGVLAGLSIKPNTPVSAIQPYIDYIDLLLIMSVEPGFSFQSFIPDSITKVKEARQLLGDTIIIEGDGGISEVNMMELKEAGLDWFVMGGGFFKSPNYETLTKKIQTNF